MTQSKRSEGRDRACLVAKVIVGVIAFGGFFGCQTPQIVQDAFPAPKIYEGRTLDYEEAQLSEISARKRIEEIDQQFAEPRTRGRVRLSQETAQYSISRESNYGSLWRGARACAWLAGDAGSPTERRDCALDGITWGKAAVEKDSTSAESYYYLAINYLHLFDLQFRREPALARRIEENLKMARSLDPHVDNCGPSRALGFITIKMVDQPLLSFGSRSEGIFYLKEATQTCNGFGKNYLVLAKALIEIEDYAGARAALDTLVSLPSPHDHTVDHQKWLAEASHLLTDLPGI